MKEGVEATAATSASNKAENGQLSVPPQSSAPLAETNAAPITPTKLIQGPSTSPQTEEIHREKIPTSLESVSSSPGSGPGSSSPEAIALIDQVVEAVRVIHQFSKYPYAVPPNVHSRILQSHWSDSQEAIDAVDWDQWSDGSMWMHVLEMGSTQNQRVTILNMIEYVGAWEWYDKQIRLAKATVRTKKNKPVDHKGAATHVLNDMQSTQRGPAPQGRWIGGVGWVAPEQKGSVSDLESESGGASITEKSRRLQRKRISVQLSRGQKITTLVKKLGLGILFSPTIW